MYGANRGAINTIKGIKEKLLLHGARTPSPSWRQRAVEHLTGALVDPTIPEFTRLGRDLARAGTALNPSKTREVLETAHAPEMSAGLASDAATLLPEGIKRRAAAAMLSLALARGKSAA